MHNNNWMSRSNSSSSHKLLRNLVDCLQNIMIRIKNVVNNKQHRRTQRLLLMIMKMILSTHLVEIQIKAHLMEMEMEMEMEMGVLISPTHPNFTCLREVGPILNQWNHILLGT